MKYDIKGPLYKVAFAGLIGGAVLAGEGMADLYTGSGNFGLEELVGGLLIAGGSFYYRQKCRNEYGAALKKSMKGQLSIENDDSKPQE